MADLASDESSAQAASGEKKSGEKAAVRVMVRVRPFNRRELGDDPTEYPMSIVMMEGNKVNMMDSNGGLADSFEFHETFWSIPESQKQFCSAPFADQEAVFNSIGLGAVENAIKGYHTCIFAYGQTGSGKTHTMLGSLEDPGIAPRLVGRLFERLEDVRKDEQWTYAVEVSFMEIYNEKVKDLLLTSTPTPTRSGRKRKSMIGDSPRESSFTTPTTSNRGNSFSMGRSLGTPSKKPGSTRELDYADLRVRSSPATGIFVEGLTRLGHEQGLKTADDVIDTMRSGMEHRTTAATAMNDTSSRSHAVFQICLRANNGVTGTQRYAHINIVDLAGSERIKMSKVQGQSLTEATKINLSLSTLRRVIDVLIENSLRKKNKMHPPYRDSMLTWILSESLGGNSKTMMIATVSPAESNREDTLNTLRYALKAKAIVNTVKVNEQKSSVMLGAMQREMENLRKKLNDPDVVRSQEEIKELQLQQEELAAEFTQQQENVQQATERVQQMQVELQQKELEKIQREKELAALVDEKLEEKHAEEREAAALAEQKREEALKKTEEAQKEVEKTTTELTKAEQEWKAVAAKTEETKLLAQEASHVTTHEKRGYFKEAFKRAFVVGKRDKKKRELEGQFAEATTGASRANMEIFKVNDEIKHFQIMNQRLLGHVTRTEAEATHCEQRIVTEARKKGEELSSIEHALAELKVELKALAARAAAEEKKKQQVAAPPRTSSAVEQEFRLRSLEETVSQARQLHAEKEAGLKATLNNKTILTQLLTDITQENEKVGVMVKENRVKVSEVQSEVSKLQEENSVLRTELQGLEESITDTRDSISSQRGRLARLREQVDARQEKHSKLRNFASEKFFPAGKSAGRLGTPALPADLAPRTTDSADTDRAWARSGGVMYVRALSPCRRSGATRDHSPDRYGGPRPGSPGNAFRRSGTII